jgi:hypothetical protein
MKALAGIGLAVSLLATPIQARADGGQIAAGIIGGLAAGAIIGSIVRPPPPVYYAPAPVYVAPPPPPVYVAPTPACYYAPGAPVWDAYRGIWVRPPVQVCR